MGSGLMKSEMGMVNKNGQVVLIIMVNGKIIWLMDMVYSNMLMEMNIKEM